MIQNASEKYGYENDDILTDSLAGLANMSCNAGEILGPFFAGIFIDAFGFEITAVIAAFFCFGFSIVYLFFSGIFEKFQKKQEKKTIYLSMNPLSIQINQENSD